MRTKQIALLMVMSICIALFAASIFALTIKVKTLSDHRISIIIREAGKLTSLESFHKDTGTGDVEITSAVTTNPIDILATLKKDGQNIINRKYESVNNENLFLLFIPGDDKLMTQAEVDAEAKAESPDTAPDATVAETTDTTTGTAETPTEATKEIKETDEPKEKTEKETTTKNSEEDQEKTSSTGFALLNSEMLGDNSKLIKTGLGILVLVGLLMMIWMFFMRKKEENFTVRPWSEIKQEITSKNNPTSHQVEEIERKMKALQSELENIKNKDSHVHELKERYKRDQAELRRLGVQV